MSSSDTDNEYPIVKHTVNNSNTQETATIIPTQDTAIFSDLQETSLDYSNQEDVNDDDGDFTQRTQIRLERESRERRVKANERFESNLHEMYASGGSGKVKAGAYLSSSLDAKAKRAGKAKTTKSKKVKNRQKVKSYQEAHAVLFGMNVDNIHTPKRKSPNTKPTKLSKLKLATTSSVKSKPTSTPNVTSKPATTPTSITLSNRNVTTPSTHSSKEYSTPSNGTVSTVVSSSFTDSQVNASVGTNSSDVTGSGSTGVVCNGCGHPMGKCHEVRFREMCLQAVMDHFEDDNIRFTDELGIYTAFIRAYTFCVKKDMLDKHGFYERRVEVEIPSCMVNGSLAEAQSLRTVDVLRRSLLGQRVFDVPTYVEQVKKGERSVSAPATYDRIVRDNQW